MFLTISLEKNYTLHASEFIPFWFTSDAKIHLSYPGTIHLKVNLEELSETHISEIQKGVKAKQITVSDLKLLEAVIANSVAQVKAEEVAKAIVFATSSEQDKIKQQTLEAAARKAISGNVYEVIKFIGGDTLLNGELGRGTSDLDLLGEMLKQESAKPNARKKIVHQLTARIANVKKVSIIIEPSDMEVEEEDVTTIVINDNGLTTLISTIDAELDEAIAEADLTVVE